MQKKKIKSQTQPSITLKTFKTASERKHKKPMQKYYLSTKSLKPGSLSLENSLYADRQRYMYMRPLSQRPCLGQKERKISGKKSTVHALTEQCKLQSWRAMQVFHPLWVGVQEPKHYFLSNPSYRLMQVRTDSPAQAATRADTGLKKRTHLAGTGQKIMVK